MASLFESARQAWTLLLSLPFALAGAFWTLFVTGTDFDQPAAVGLLLLIGTVVNNGIVMLAHVNHYRNAGMPRYDAHAARLPRAPAPRHDDRVDHHDLAGADGGAEAVAWAACTTTRWRSSSWAG